MVKSIPGQATARTNANTHRKRGESNRYPLQAASARRRPAIMRPRHGSPQRGPPRPAFASGTRMGGSRRRRRRCRPRRASWRLLQPRYVNARMRTSGHAHLLCQYAQQRCVLTLLCASLQPEASLQKEAVLRARGMGGGWPRFKVSRSLQVTHTD